MVEAVLAEAGLAPGDLDRIGVTVGPGSFAGTRVGTAFARGLALATGARAVGIANLAVIAHQHGDVCPWPYCTTPSAAKSSSSSGPMPAASRRSVCRWPTYRRESGSWAAQGSF